MNSNTAKRIIALVNSRNNLPEEVTTDDVFNGQYFYLEKDILDSEDKDLVCCVRAKRMSFFAYELKHLSVNPKYERQGFGAMMAGMVEEHARYKGIPMVMATSNISNEPVNKLFTRLGYNAVKNFVNMKTGHNCNVWQKVL